MFSCVHSMDCTSSQVLIQVLIYVKHLFSTYIKDGFLGDLKLWVTCWNEQFKSDVLDVQLCSLYGFHQQSSLDRSFDLCQTSFQLIRKRWISWRHETWVTCWDENLKSDVLHVPFFFFLWMLKRRISWRHEFLKFETCRNVWLLIELINISNSTSVIYWDEWFNSDGLDVFFFLSAANEDFIDFIEKLTFQCLRLL